MNENEFERWSEVYLAALLDLSKNKQKGIEEATHLLENNFDLIGSTAIEDRLQQGVPDTINHIKRAGIKIWVLTGDKTETAINIGFSSSLLDEKKKICIIDGTTAQALSN